MRDGWLTVALLFPLSKYSLEPSDLHIPCHLLWASWAVVTISWFVFLLSFLPTFNSFSPAAQVIHLKLEHELPTTTVAWNSPKTYKKVCSLLQVWLSWPLFISLPLCLICTPTSHRHPTSPVSLGFLDVTKFIPFTGLWHGLCFI